MPKKQPKSGFFYFMLSYKRRAESRGKTFPGGMPEVVAAASPEWRTLPQVRKDYYNDLAKERRNDPRPSIPKRDERKFNSQGVSFAELKMEKAKAEERRKQERDFISNYVHEMNLNDLRDKLMYIIHVNIFCKTDKDVYYPAEIGMVKFSLRGGVKGVFHRYIDPGDIAPGYSFEVKDHSERTHKLTPHFVRSVDGTSDFTRLYKEICEFLTEDEVKSEGTMPPLFTMYDNVFLNSSLDAVKGTFKALWAHIHPSHDQNDNSWENEFRVFPLPDMFFHLKNRCMEVTNPQTIAFPNDVLAKSQLQKETYHYELDTACKFHRDEDIIAHCSQSFVLRWVYIIRDHCAELIGVDLFPKYVAPKTEIKEEDEDEDKYDTKSMTDSQYSNSWSEASRETSDWGMKRGKDRYSPERKVKRERERYYSPERRVKREKDRYYSPDRHVKQERGRYSPDGPVKRERDRYSPNRQVKRERDGQCSPERVPKHERDDRTPERVTPERLTKHERDDRTPERVTSERLTKRESDDRTPERVTPERLTKHERDDRTPERVTSERLTKRESDDRTPERVTKRERDDRTPERLTKRERDMEDRSITGAVKHERNFDGFPGASTSIRNVEAYVVKCETDTGDVLYDGTFKREKVETVAAGSTEVVPKVEPFKFEPIDVEEEAACWYSQPAPMKRETDKSNKCEKNADSIGKDDTSVKHEDWSKKEKVAVKEENINKEKEVATASGRPKVETVDLTYSDW